MLKLYLRSKKTFLAYFNGFAQIPHEIHSTKAVSKMKSFVCVLFLSVLAGSYAVAISNDTDIDQKTKIMNMLNGTSYQVVEIDETNQDAIKVLVRVRRSNKILKKGCERDLALISTGVGGAAGAGVGAASGAIAGSVI